MWPGCPFAGMLVGTHNIFLRVVACPDWPGRRLTEHSLFAQCGPFSVNSCPRSCESCRPVPRRAGSSFEAQCSTVRARQRSPRDGACGTVSRKRTMRSESERGQCRGSRPGRLDDVVLSLRVLQGGGQVGSLHGGRSGSPMSRVCTMSLELESGHCCDPSPGRVERRHDVAFSLRAVTQGDLGVPQLFFSISSVPRSPPGPLQRHHGRVLRQGAAVAALPGSHEDEGSTVRADPRLLARYSLVFAMFSASRGSLARCPWCRCSGRDPDAPKVLRSYPPYPGRSSRSGLRKALCLLPWPG